MFDLKMIISSVLAGLFSSMNIYTDKFQDTRFHLNDVYMIVLMTSLMMILMQVLNHHYDHTTILIGITVLISLYCIRRQALITDRQFLKGMIPHHSMAVHMSKYILKRTHNPRIKQLARKIIRSQNQEILLMNQILKN